MLIKSLNCVIIKIFGVHRNSKLCFALHHSACDTFITNCVAAYPTEQHNKNKCIHTECVNRIVMLQIFLLLLTLSQQNYIGDCH